MNTPVEGMIRPPGGDSLVKPRNLVAAALVVASMSAGLVRAADGPALRLTVVAVRAVPAADGVVPGIGDGLADVAGKLKRLPFARYELVTMKSEDVPAGERVTVAFGGSGRLVVSARPKDAGYQLGIAEYAPGSSAPCLSSEAQIDAGKAQITFCDGVPERAATMVFITTVKPAN